jgi:AcrR family transcriptional regulator
MGGMASPVKRPYDNAGRQARSEATRSRILEVARELFTTHGYRATTIAEIAHIADVHLDTIYDLVGRKPAMLRELIERAISGTDRALAPDERGYVQAIRIEPDPARKLAIYASAVCEIHARMAPLLLALRDAATTDDDAQQVWREINERRAQNMRDLVRDLGPDGTLRKSLSVGEAADVVWATASAEMFVLFTQERGWTPESYARWLSSAWSLLLLSSDDSRTKIARRKTSGSTQP